MKPRALMQAVEDGDIKGGKEVRIDHEMDAPWLELDNRPAPHLYLRARRRALGTIPMPGMAWQARL